MFLNLIAVHCSNDQMSAYCMISEGVSDVLVVNFSFSYSCEILFSYSMVVVSFSMIHYYIIQL